MENSWSLDPLLWIVIGIISLAAIITGSGLIAKAFSFQNRYGVSLAICLISTLLLTSAGVLVPLLILAGQTYDQHSLLVDILMIGISMLFLIAVASFIVDHLAERPDFLMIAAGACFSIALFPWTYQLFRNPLNDRFRILVIQPEMDLPLSLDDFNERYAPGVESPAAAFNEDSEAASESGMAASEGDEPSPAPGPRTTPERDWLYGDP